ncbi:MAG: DNA cytosine methyltransferase [Eubacteriales bacterium]|nr:DNA cytosine methyltransferase [Eubacteriales bacterium]MDD4513744.1 DNA cytosine methyltransferase [Eubacteriales bacterium]
MAGQGAKARSIAAMEDCSPTLKGCPSGLNQAPSIVYAIDPLSSNSMKSNNPHSGFHEAEVAKCIDTSDQNPGKNQGGNVVVMDNGETVFPRVARTLTAEADASPCVDRGQNVVAIDCRNMAANEELSATLQAKSGGGTSLNYINPIVYDARGNGNGQVASVITGDHEARIGDYTNVVTFAQNQRDEVRDLNGKTGAVSAHPGAKQQTYVALETEPQIYPMQAFGAYNEAGAPASSVKARDFKDATDLVVGGGKPPRRFIVRRLTPIECQRLQGFPDGWGTPNPKADMSDDEAAFWECVRRTHAEATGKRYTPCKTRDALIKWYNGLHTDSAEYKMWGNGIALPCAAYVLQGAGEAVRNG